MGGLGAIFAEGASIGLSSVGLGLSMTGEFKANKTVYAGGGFGLKFVPVAGNLYADVSADLSKLIPEEVRKYLSISGSGLITSQIGKSGKALDEAKNLFSGNPIKALKAMV